MNTDPEPHELPSPDSRGRAIEIGKVVYDELRQIAAAKFRRERPGHVLRPTALVNEAFLRLIGTGAIAKNDKSYFLASAAQAMQRILIDHYWQETADKRGGGRERIPLTEATGGTIAPPRTTILDIQALLPRLADEHPLVCNVVQMRVYSGCTIEETAQALNVSVAIVKRDWAFGIAWLRDRLTSA